MKINTITCHDVYNHGASLQAYSLMKYLEDKGHKVEIIDYKPDYLSNHYKILSIDNPIWEKNILTKAIYLTLKIPGRILSLKRKREFDNFTKKYLKLTNRRYSSNDDLKKALPKADAYICGSDQIWNSLHKNGKDKAFYLDFVPNNKIKISYAASFATDSIDDNMKIIVKKLLSNFHGIGVRESSGVNIVKELQINNVINVLDPVFLLDQNQWNKIANEKFNDKYILVYDFDNNPLIHKLAKEIAKREGLKIYSINNYKSRYVDKNFNNSGPETFISLIRDSEFVLSNSFHALVFSIIYKKQVAIVNRNESINVRMRDLLVLLNLKDRLISNEEYDLDYILKRIDYKKVSTKLNTEIKISKKYLLDNLKL